MVKDLVKGLNTDAQRALQVSRSIRGNSVALVGMGTSSHVNENLALAKVPPLSHAEASEIVL